MKPLEDTYLDSYFGSNDKPSRLPETPEARDIKPNSVDASISNPPRPPEAPSEKRSDSFVKYPFNATVGSFNAPSGSRSVEELLGLMGVWNSEYSSVQRMLDHFHDYESGSVRSAQSYCYHVASFCRYARCGPDELVKLDREVIERMFQDYAGTLRKRGLMSRSINSYLRQLKTIFVVNGFSRENGRELRVKTLRESRIFADEYVPTLQEALLMAERAGSKRNRAILLTLITSGLRNTSLRALQMCDISEQIQAKTQILRIDVRRNWNLRLPGAAKNGIEYVTFIAPAGVKAIESMLRERESLFRTGPKEDEPLFVSNYNQIARQARSNKPLSMRQLEQIVHSAAQSAEIPLAKKVRVHSLRKVFNAVLRSPLADGTQMDPTDQEYLMGHEIPGIQQSYYDPTKVGRLRELYGRLVFEDRSVAQDIELRILVRIARSLDVKWTTEVSAREEQLGRKLTVEEYQEFLTELIKAKRDSEVYERRIANVDELEGLLLGGWKVESILPDSRVIVARRRSITPS